MINDLLNNPYWGENSNLSSGDLSYRDQGFIYEEKVHRKGKTYRGFSFEYSEVPKIFFVNGYSSFLLKTKKLKTKYQNTLFLFLGLKIVWQYHSNLTNKDLSYRDQGFIYEKSSQKGKILHKILSITCT